MKIAVAFSEHPVAAEAAGELLGAALEAVGDRADLAVLFASGAHAEFLGELATSIGSVLRPTSLIGAATPSVLAGSYGVDDRASACLWVASDLPARSHRSPASGPDGAVIADRLAAEVAEDATLLVLADPATWPVDDVLARLATVRPDVDVVGGLCAPAGAPPATVVLDGSVHRDGAVAVSIPPGICSTIVSPGCRPVGEPMVVTGADRNFLLELAGRPALEQLQALLDTASPEDRPALGRGVDIGVVIDERRHSFRPDDFVIRPVRGADRARGVLAVDEPIPLGTTVQFQARDSPTAATDLHARLAGHDVEGALVFTDGRRATELFGDPQREAEIIADALAVHAVAGMSCHATIGRVGPRSHLHALTTTVALFGPASRPTR